MSLEPSRFFNNLPLQVETRSLVAIVLLLVTFVAQSSAQASSSGITYHGRILKPDGSPLESSGVQFRLQIRSPGTENCLLYEERQTKSMVSSGGVFSITLNDGSGSRGSADEYASGQRLTLERVFQNKTGYPSTLPNCDFGAAYLPNAADGRRFQVAFKDASMTDWEPMPAQMINYVPFALEAKSLSGFTPQNLLRVEDGSGPQPANALTPAQFAELEALTLGNSLIYMKTSANGAQAPVRSGNPASPAAGQFWFDTGTSQLKYYDGSQVQVVGGSGGALPALTSGSIWVGNGSNAATAVTMSGDATLSNAGALTLKNTGTAGTYFQVTTDAQGRVTSGSSSLTEANIPTLSTAGKVLGSAINTGIIGGNTAINTTGNITSAGLSANGLWLNGNGNQIRVAASPSLSGNLDFILPPTNGTSGHVLTTNGSGVLSWAAPSTSSQWTTSGNDIYYNVASGNVGIGTATPAALLHVSNGRTHLETLSGGLTNVLTLGNTHVSVTQDFGSSMSFKTGSALLGDIGSAWSTSGDTGSSYMRFETRTGGALTEKVRITSAGNLGIGTTTPSEKLEVTGNILIPNNFSLQAKDSGGTTRPMMTWTASNDLSFGGLGVVHMPFYTTGAERMRIDAAGRVGIGTTSPTKPLDVNSEQRIFRDTGYPTLYLDAANANTGQGAIVFRTGRTNNTAYPQAGDWLGQINFRNQNDAQGAIISAVASENQSGAATGTQLRFYTVPNGTLSTQERLRITNDGRVGIGTITPAVSLDVSGFKDAIRLPAGNGSTERPATPALGMLRYNTTDDKLEFHNGSSWQVLSSGGSSTTVSNVSTISNTGGITLTAGAGQAVLVSNGTSSLSPTTGALVVTGGAGISGDTNIGGNVTSNGSISATNATAASGSANQSSPSIYLSANYWNGSASAVDRFSITNALGSGTNPSATLTFDHVAGGTSGAKAYAFLNGNVGVGTHTPLTTSVTIGTPGYRPIVAIGQSVGYTAAPTVLQNSVYLGIGHNESGANTYRLIGFGYNNDINTNYPAFVGYQEMDNTGSSKGDLIFGTRAVTTPAVPSERMRIDSNGNIGIGTSTPGGLLDLLKTHNGTTSVGVTNYNNTGGSARSSYFATNSSGAASFGVFGEGYGTAALANTAAIRASSGLAALNMSTIGASPITFGTTDTERMRITPTGRVGIATTAPEYTLDVGGSIRATSGISATMTDQTSGISVYNFNSTTGRYPSFSVWNFQGSTSGGAPLFKGIGSRGNAGAVAPSQTGDILSAFNGAGMTATGATWGTGDSGGMNVLADENFGPGASGGALTFNTTLNGQTFSTERMRITNAGAVGIGTSNPSRTLHVIGDIWASGLIGGAITELNPSQSTLNANSGLRINIDRDNDETGVGFVVGTNNSNQHYQNTGELFRVSDNGNVGIGNPTPQAALDVTATGTSSAIILPRADTANRPSPVNGMIRYNTSNNKLEAYENGGWINMIGGGGGSVAGANTQIQFNNSGSFGASANFNWDNTNNQLNVGGSLNGAIQVNNVSGTLSHIPLYLAQANLADGNTSAIVLGRSSNSNSSGTIAYRPSATAGQNTLELGHYGHSPTLVVTNGSGTAPGNVGVGITTPSSLLHVERNANSSTRIYVKNPNNGNAADAFAEFENDVGDRISIGINSSTYGGVGSSDNGTSYIWNVNGNPLVFATASAEVMRLTSNGNLAIGGTSAGEKLVVYGNAVASSFLYSSDERLKTNIEPVEDSLAKITRLSGVTFDWRKPSSVTEERKQIGLIAQEVRETFPEAVVESKDGFLKVNYPALVAPVIEAIKELHAKWTDQSTEIARLKQENEELKRRLDRIEESLNQRSH